MLDLGFREDLETMLEAAPAERRTLLLSATLPPEIRALAKRYQRDALPIDPATPRRGRRRPGPARTTTSLTSRTWSPAAIGWRRSSTCCARPPARAPSSSARRARVSARCTRRWSRAASPPTAISGERAQAERDRALDQLRRGEARVLVATNVAARGLHLPDVDLIVHADLPLNAESLTHRSGRTGRAGRKGTAVVIATLAERRKAERLLAIGARRAAWTPPPSARQIAAARAQLLEDCSPRRRRDGAVGEAPELRRRAICWRRIEAGCPSRIWRAACWRASSRRLPAGETLAAGGAAAAGGERGFGARDAPDRAARTRAPGDFAREGVRVSREHRRRRTRPIRAGCCR